MDSSPPVPAAVQSQTSRRSTFSRRVRLLTSLIGAGQQLQIGLLVLAKVALGLCDLLLAYLMYLLFLVLQGTTPTGVLSREGWVPHSLTSVALASLAVVVLRLFGEIAVTRHIIVYTQGLYQDCMLRLVRGYCDLRWTVYVQRNRSELLKYCTATALDAAYSYQLLIEEISSALVVLLLTLALFYKGFWIACTLAAMTSLMFLVHRFWLRKRMRLASASRERASRILQIGLAEVFSAAREIRAYRNAAFFQKRLVQEGATLAESNVRLGTLPQISRVMAEQGVVVFFLLVVIAVELWSGDVKRLLSILVFYFVLSRRLLPLISQMILNMGQMEGAYENLETIEREFRRNAENLNPVSVEAPPPSGLALQLEHIAFTFDDGRAILRDVNLDLARSEMLVLRGISGVGKSSLLNVIAGVAQPSSGAVRLLRSTMSYVPQEITLLDDSIRVNLLFGLQDRTDAELMDALDKASLTDLVLSLPHGLGTRVGDNGVLFSGGQRQRLGIARALLRHPDLLLLDEATSALDEENERRVLTSIRTAEGPAILLVTHRVHADFSGARLAHLSNGELVEERTAASVVEQAISDFTS